LKQTLLLKSAGFGKSFMLIKRNALIKLIFIYKRRVWKLKWIISSYMCFLPNEISRACFYNSKFTVWIIKIQSCIYEETTEGDKVTNLEHIWNATMIKLKMLSFKISSKTSLCVDKYFFKCFCNRFELEKRCRCWNRPIPPCPFYSHFFFIFPAFRIW
jgi:hypothetical protein